MSRRLLKRLAAKLPATWQHELRRHHFQREIRHHSFFTDEKEYGLLPDLLRPGDWAIDIGANVGHYTLRMSELVGPTGRVIAVEPVPETFSLLSANVRRAANSNVSLLNVAASDRVASMPMQVPQFDSGLSNYFQARLSDESGGFAVLAMPIDSLALPSIRLVKLDVEGHELPALHGMRALLTRDHPVLIVETSASETTALLDDLGYLYERLPGSSNLVCKPPVLSTP
jgi:FkbM family methyltransferase